MLQLITQSIIISLFCIIWGVPVVLLLKRFNQNTEFWIRTSLGFYCFLFCSGLLLLSFITSVQCLFLPLNFYSLLFLTTGLLIYLFIQRKNVKSIFKEFPLQFSFAITESVFIFICILIFLVAGSLNPANNDTQVYHIQIIRWFNEYGAVPGIANLFPRYGTGSNWFNLISIFRIPGMSYENFTWLNTTFVAWFFIWLMNNWKFHSNNSSVSNRVMSHFYFLLLLYSLFEWELFRDAASSTNYDFIITALTLMALSFLVESFLFPGKSKKFSFILAVICISVIPFKLSGVFLLLPLLYHLIISNKIKYWTYTVIAGVLILTPFLIKNYFISGYLFFPVSFSIASPDWQLPKEMADYYRQYIHLTNRYYNSINLDFKHLPELINKPWINDWFHGILIQQKLIIFAAFSSLFLLFFKTKLTADYKKIKILFFLMLVMATGWFFSAPSPRFGYGVLLPLAFFPICFFIGQRISMKIHQPVIIFTIFISCYYLYKKSAPIINNPANILHTVKLIQPPLHKVYINGMGFNLPEYVNHGWMRDCFNTDIPCIYQENKYLMPRGSSLKDGFKMDPHPDSTFIRNYVY
jgi:hypothetical protein